MPNFINEHTGSRYEESLRLLGEALALAKDGKAEDAAKRLSKYRDVREKMRTKILPKAFLDALTNRADRVEKIIRKIGDETQKES